MREIEGSAKARTRSQEKIKPAALGPRVVIETKKRYFKENIL